MKYKEKAGIFLVFYLFVTGLPAAYPAQSSQVARAIFTTKIVDREPIDQVLMISDKTPDIFFFTDLRHFEGQTITHRWLYNDKVESVVSFKVKGPRWRVYSRKEIKPGQTGKWTVVVQNESGQSLKASVFRVVDGTEQQVILPLEN